MESELIEQRRKKLEELRSLGINPFPNDFKPSHEAATLPSKYGDLSGEELHKVEEEFSLAGRVMSIRDFGKSVFFHIMDRTGQIQGYLRKDVAGEEKLDFFNKFVDIGDFIGIKGPVLRQKQGSLR